MLQAKQQGQDPQTAAALAQKDAQLQQMQAQLEKVGKPTAVEEVRQQGESERTHLQLLADREKMHADNETKIVIAELTALSKELQDTRALFMQERARLGVQADTAAGQQHEVGMAAMQQAGTADQAAQQREAAEEAAEAGRQHEMTMAEQQQAAQQPTGGA
jgi:hypothetical protein